MKARLLILIIALFALTGCSPSPVEELFRLPELPQEFVEFNDQLSAIRANGAELTAPLAGYNRQSVQLMDLDNDGIDEGIAFATKKNDAKRAVMYVFKKQGESYQVLGEIEGPGNLVDSVSYSDLMGNGNYEIIIGWGLEDNSARTLTAYEITSGGMEKLLEVPYLYYVQADMEGDGIADLSVVMPDEKNKSPELSFFSRGMGELRFRSSVQLSQGISQIKKIRAGYASDGVPAIFIDSAYNDKVLTDIIVLKEGQLVNATRDEQTGASEQTARGYQINCEDADGDGIIEVPTPAPFPGYNEESSAAPLCGITWRKYTAAGKLEDSAYTYHDYTDSWHIVLPLKWRGKITAERMGQDRGVMFYSIDSQGKKSLMFSIYVLMGESRYTRAAYSGRFQLTEKQNIIYAGSIKKDSYLGVEINEDSLREMFRWRETEWSSGEVVA